MCLKAGTLKKCAWEWVSANRFQTLLHFASSIVRNASPQGFVSFLRPLPFTQIWTIRLAFSSMLSTLPPPVSTPVAASFLTAIMTPPEVQLTLYNSLVLRAVAAATFPLLLRVSTSYSVYKPQRHPCYFLYPSKNIFRCTKKTHSSARISAILPLSSFCSVFCCSSILSCSCWW